MKKISKLLLILALTSLVLLGVLIGCDQARGLEDIEININELKFRSNLKELIFITDGFVPLLREDFKLEEATAGSGTAGDPFIWEEISELFGPDGNSGGVAGEMVIYVDGDLIWEYYVEFAANKLEENTYYRITIAKEGFSFIDAEAAEEDSEVEPFIRKTPDNK